MSAFDRNSTGGAVARPGDAVRLAWAPEHTFVIPFDEEAGLQPAESQSDRGEE
jgi:hypothetical protein